MTPYRTPTPPNDTVPGFCLRWEPSAESWLGVCVAHELVVIGVMQGLHDWTYRVPLAVVLHGVVWFLGFVIQCDRVPRDDL